MTNTQPRADRALLLAGADINVGNTVIVEIIRAEVHDGKPYWYAETTGFPQYHELFVAAATLEESYRRTWDNLVMMCKAFSLREIQVDSMPDAMIDVWMNDFQNQIRGCRIQLWRYDSESLQLNDFPHIMWGAQTAI